MDSTNSKISESPCILLGLTSFYYLNENGQTINIFFQYIACVKPVILLEFPLKKLISKHQGYLLGPNHDNMLSKGLVKMQ